MIFSNDSFLIDPKNQMWVFRINEGHESPSKIGNWDYNARSIVEDNGIGIYGVPALNLSLGFDLFFRMFLSTIKQESDLRFLLMEIDKKDIVFINPFEVSFSRCNIKKIFTKSEFLKFSHSFSGFNNIDECFDNSEYAVKLFRKENYYEWLAFMQKSMHNMFSNIRNLNFVPEQDLLDLEKQYMDRLKKRCDSLISDYLKNLK